MRDLTQADALGIDTSDMVVVTHPDKKARYGGGLAQFTMTKLSYIKRGLAAKGYKIIGDASEAAQPTAREQSLMAELEELRRQVAEAAPTADGTDDKRARLEAEANELGIKVHPNAKDETIERKIAEARAVQDLDDEDEDLD